MITDVSDCLLFYKMEFNYYTWYTIHLREILIARSNAE